MDRQDALFRILMAIVVAWLGFFTAVFVDPGINPTVKVLYYMTSGIIGIVAGVETTVIYKVMPLVMKVRKRPSSAGTSSPPELTKKEIPLLRERLGVLAKAETLRTKEEAFSDVYAMLLRLPPKRWSRQLRRVVFEALDYLAGGWTQLNLDDRSHMLFAILLSIGKDKKAFEYARKKFFTISQDSYKLPELEAEPIRYAALGSNALKLAQEFQKHEEKFELTLADESMQWGNDKWRNLWASIELWRTRKSDSNTFQRMRDHFESVRKESEKAGDSEKGARATAFFEQIRNQS